RQGLLWGGFGRDGDHLAGGPISAFAVPGPHRCGEVLHRDDDPGEAVLPGGVVGGAQFQRHLVLVAQVDLLDVAAPAQVPEVQPVPVLAAEQQVGVDAVLDHVRGAPLGGDRDVAGEVPPEVVGQVLRAAVDLPAAQHLEGVVVQDGDAAGPAAVRAAQRGDVQPVGAAVHGVRAGVAGPLGQLLGLD